MPLFHAYMYMLDSWPIVGLAMNRFNDWLWSMYAPRDGRQIDQRAHRQLHAVR